MLPKIALVLVLLAQAPAGLVGGEFMLCFHRDGRVEVERYDLLCCKDNVSAEDRGGEQSPATPSPCPDDSCQDVPLSVGAAQSLDTPLVLEKSSEVSLPVGEFLAVLPEEPRLEMDRRAPGAGPPLDTGLREHLRTVVLRF